MNKPLRVLVIGSGGREHALVRCLSASPLVQSVISAPGNGGIAPCSRRNVRETNIEGLCTLAVAEQADLVVVGPEAPLELGIVDELTARDIRTFGPTRAAAQLETNKAFTQTLCQSTRIPIAYGWVARTVDEAFAIIDREWPRQPLVVKAAGLCGGKGVTVPETALDAGTAVYKMIEGRSLGDAGTVVVIQERLEGAELSYQVITDGTNIRRLLTAGDYKRRFDDNQGPNTGGMGAYAPGSNVSTELLDEIDATIIVPTLRALAARGTPYRGVLYAGLILTKGGPRLIEYNCRFGDPETQTILALLNTDLVPYLTGATRANGLADLPPIAWKDGAAVSVALVSDGYPETYITGHVISGIHGDPTCIHAGTERRDGELITNGGRVIYAIGTGPNLDSARQQAYRTVAWTKFKGMSYRTDIGTT